MRRPLVLMRGRLPLALAVVAIAALLAACSAERTSAPSFVQRVVVHAVLDPLNSEQLVLVEQTRGDSAVPRGTLSARDPIASVGGLPVSGARVVIVGPEGDSALAVEDRSIRTDGSGAGVYRLRSVTRPLSGSDTPAGVLRLTPGSRYDLVVQTSLGTVRGNTRMPNFPLVPDRITRRFNLDADTLRLPRPSSEVGAAAYIVRHTHPGFSSSSRVTRIIRDRLLAPAGAPDDRWEFDAERGRIWPGTTQSFSVAAVDANFLKYSVAGADPFGDDVQGNTLEGGVGLFGSVAMLTDVALDLEAARDHAVEGEWRASSALSGFPVTLRLFESPNFPRPATAGLALTGTGRLATGGPLAAVGTLDGTAFSLALAPSANAANTRLFSGTFDGTTLTLQAAGSQAVMRYRLAGGGA